LLGRAFCDRHCRPVVYPEIDHFEIEWRRFPVRALETNVLQSGVESMEDKPSEPKQPKPVVGVYRRSHILRNLIILIVIAVVGIGVYRQWFTVTTHDRDDDQKVDVKLTVDKAKIEADTKLAVKKTEEEASKLSTKVKEEASKLRDKSN
jgi:hypothetical protein